MTRKSAALVVAVAGLALSSGCAFGNRTARLRWPANPGETIAVAPPATAPAVSLSPISDLRAEPRRVVGYVRNGLGMHTADVVTDDDVARWSTAALQDELHRAGVRVVEAAPGVPAVGAELRRLHGEAAFTYKGEVELRAWLKTGEAAAFDQNVRGLGSGGMNWAATGEGYAGTLAAALKDATAKVARAVAVTFGLAPPPPQPPPPPPAAVQAETGSW